MASNVQSVSDSNGDGKPIKKSAEDFIFGKVLGEGSFSTVYLSKDIHTNREYAIKVCEKSLIIREKKIEQIKREKEVFLNLAKMKYFVHLYCSFQDQSNLYFVMTYAKNGELLTKINQLKGFDGVTVRFLAAEILLALEFLKLKKIVHRDLKPENIMLDSRMHILIGDFGSSKILTARNMEELALKPTSKNSFVGTAQFVSPEVLENKPITYACDLWAFGCIIYQMAVGILAFSANSEYLIFRKILKLEYSFPESCSDYDIIDLVSKLLVIEHINRIGYADFDNLLYLSIRDHSLFQNVDFSNLGESPLLNLFPDCQTTDYSFPNLSPGFDPLKITRCELNGFSEDLQKMNETDSKCN